MYGFKPGEYRKVIVSWGWDDDVPQEVGAQGIELWDFRQIVKEIGSVSMAKSSYFTDDTLRTIQLFAKALLEKKKAQPA